MRSSFIFGFLPEQIVEGFVECLGDGDAQMQGGIVPAVFDEADGLPCDAYFFSQFGLREVVLHSGQL